jgi:hypothetical protein
VPGTAEPAPGQIRYRAGDGISDQLGRRDDRECADGNAEAGREQLARRFTRLRAFQSPLRETHWATDSLSRRAKAEPRWTIRSIVT